MSRASPGVPSGKMAWSRPMCPCSNRACCRSGFLKLNQKNELHIVISAHVHNKETNCTAQYTCSKLHIPMCTLQSDLSNTISCVVRRVEEEEEEEEEGEEEQEEEQEAKEYLEHSCEAHLLVVSGCAEVHGACHVCGAAVELSTTVQQQQCVLVHLLATALLSSVVDDSSIPAGSCNNASKNLLNRLVNHLVNHVVSHLVNHLVSHGVQGRRTSV